ncbi:MAG: N-acetylmannosamine-6-phosphate 2-epimerase [Armatimonadetes bacterium]|nr:N-acetylmannosamine-6-phosphate 2-epimerase [Armatimonadota bacterium]
MFSFTPLQNRLIVSCQAQPGEPLHSSFIMGRMAVAAVQGGAAGIRCESPGDIAAIREAVGVNVPLIGLWKVVLPGYANTVYITPRLRDAQAVADAGADIIALDATLRAHPEGAASDVIRAVRESTGKPVMADIDTVEAALAAIEAGADCVSTTLSGYTEETKFLRTDASPKSDAPDFALLERLIALSLPVPVFAEGRIHTPEQARQALDLGAFAVVVGGAITRPQQITARFVNAVQQAVRGQ